MQAARARKVLVVDGTVAFTGGVGLADHWLGRAQDPDHWRDTQIRVRGPAVRALEASFYENWIESGGAEAPRLDPEPAERPHATPGTRTIVAWSNFSGGASNVKLLYLLSIGAARRTIDIQSPTLWALQIACLPVTETFKFAALTCEVGFGMWDDPPMLSFRRLSSICRRFPILAQTTHCRRRRPRRHSSSLSGDSIRRRGSIV